jgi:hypothetical protein
MSLLKFSEALIITNKADADCARLADKHYSRQKRGSLQFMPPGKTLVIRDAGGLIVFGWHWAQIPRADKQEGYCCSIFRNEALRRSSEIILECEELVRKEWGDRRMFTYVDADEIKTPTQKYRKFLPGYCFLKAGWRYEGRSKSGLYLLAKNTPPF